MQRPPSLVLSRRNHDCSYMIGTAITKLSGLVLRRFWLINQRPSLFLFLRISVHPRQATFLLSWSLWFHVNIRSLFPTYAKQTRHNDQSLHLSIFTSLVFPSLNCIHPNITNLLLILPPFKHHNKVLIIHHCNLL